MYSKGISWIDDCRIPFVENDNTNNWTSTRNNKPDKTGCFFRGDSGGPEMNNNGRFPANILVSDDMLNDGIVSKTTQKNKVVKNTTQMFNYSPQREYPEINDKGTNSRYYDIDKWFDKIINYE
jgi:hypothetical protein